jgi:Na+-driven multidrug efflux pump
VVLAWCIPACGLPWPAAVLSLGLNLALIPRHGAVGAAWATLGTEVTRMALAMLALRRVMPPRSICWADCGSAGAGCRR